MSRENIFARACTVLFSIESQCKTYVGKNRQNERQKRACDMYTTANGIKMMVFFRAVSQRCAYELHFAIQSGYALFSPSINKSCELSNFSVHIIVLVCSRCSANRNISRIGREKKNENKHVHTENRTCNLYTFSSETR